MSRSPRSRVRLAGKITLAVGIAVFLVGLVLLVATMSAFAFWLTVASVILNVVGITLITMKIY